METSFFEALRHVAWLGVALFLLTTLTRRDAAPDSRKVAGTLALLPILTRGADAGGQGDVVFALILWLGGLAVLLWKSPGLLASRRVRCALTLVALQVSLCLSNSTSIAYHQILGREIVRVRSLVALDGSLLALLIGLAVYTILRSHPVARPRPPFFLGALLTLLACALFSHKALAAGIGALGFVVLLEGAAGEPSSRLATWTARRGQELKKYGLPLGSLLAIFAALRDTGPLLVGAGAFVLYLCQLSHRERTRRVLLSVLVLGGAAGVAAFVLHPPILGRLLPHLASTNRLQALRDPFNTTNEQLAQYLWGIAEGQFFGQPKPSIHLYLAATDGVWAALMQGGGVLAIALAAIASFGLTAEYATLAERAKTGGRQGLQGFFLAATTITGGSALIVALWNANLLPMIGLASPFLTTGIGASLLHTALLVRAELAEPSLPHVAAPSRLLNDVPFAAGLLILLYAFQCFAKGEGHLKRIFVHTPPGLPKKFVLTHNDGLTSRECPYHCPCNWCRVKHRCQCGVHIQSVLLRRYLLALEPPR